MGRLRTERFVANRLLVEPRTVRNWRLNRKDGPPFVVVSGKAIRYDENQLEAWIAALPVGGKLGVPRANPNRRRKRRAAA